MGLVALGLFKDYEEIRNWPKQFGDVMPGDIKYKDIKERIFRETLAQKVQSSDDPNAIVALGNLENKVLNDKFLIN